MFVEQGKRYYGCILERLSYPDEDNFWDSIDFYVDKVDNDKVIVTMFLFDNEIKQLTVDMDDVSVIIEYREDN
jgi:hypothetical protein